jgi:MFS family permease
MATAEQEDASSHILRHTEVPRLRWQQIVSISIFWFALNFHWAALGLIILPSQVFKLVGQLHQGEALAFVLIPGAFVSLFANPLFGTLSDRTRGRFATWGRRRPYILVGTLVNILGLCWMATATSIPSLATAYILVQFSSNAAQAPFHALLPDIVPPEQRGLASGIMGLLLISGSIAGVIVAGQLIDAKQPLPIYQHQLWLTYGIIMAVLLVLMLITMRAVREEAYVPQQNGKRPWLTRAAALNIIGTGLAVAIVWGMMSAWNVLHVAGLSISNDIQQVILEIIATLGLLRMFDFQPRRDRDFAWVLLTRLVMMLGIYTIQTFLQYYMKDVVGAPHPEQQTTNFIIVVSLTSLVSSFAAGWLSDHLGRKRIVYISGFFMALVGLIFIVTHSLSIVIAAGAIFGLGYGAYQSVDWALVADVLPSRDNFARDMGIWNIALSLPQVIAPVLGGPLIDYFARNGQGVLGYQLLFGMAIVYCFIGTVTVRYIRGVKT